MEKVLELKKIWKTFPGVVALQNMCFTLKKGEIHAIAGENGAGKSTLIKVMAGVHIPDEGEIIVKGRQVQFTCPQDAITAGIGVVHQETSLFPDLSIMENMFIGRLPKKGFFRSVDFAKMKAEAERIYAMLDIKMDVIKPVKTLGIAEKQMLEIAKALSQNSEILILDEPTAALSIREVETLFKIIEKLKASGVSIVYISHRLEEIFQIADYISVIRDGEYVASAPVSQVDTAQLVQWMVGRDVDEFYPKAESDIGEVLLSVSGLSDGSLLRNVSFEIREGEILGFAGLAGAGRSETATAVVGLRPKITGAVLLKGKELKIRKYLDALENGIVYISEDRQRNGVTLPMSIKDNITLAMLKHICRFGVINRKKDKEVAGSYMKQFQIAAPHMNFVVGNLSGGNQQKVSVSKGLACNPRVLILDEPTRGVDVGAKAEIHDMIGRLAASGMSIIMISSEMPEVLSMSDRVVIFRQGAVAGCLSREEATQEKVLALALEAKVTEVQA